MRMVGWLGPLFVIAGLFLGGLLAGGMYAATASARAGATPQAVGPVPPPAAVTLQAGPGDATRGRAAYERECGSCHGSKGNGGTPLHGPLLNAYYRDDAALAGLVRNGVGTMPGTRADELPDQQVADVIAFMRVLP